MLSLLDEQIADDATEKSVRKELLALKEKMKETGMTAEVQKEYAELQKKLLHAHKHTHANNQESKSDEKSDAKKNTEKKTRRGDIKEKARSHIKTAAIWTGGLLLLKTAFGYAKDRVKGAAESEKSGGLREGWKSFFTVKAVEEKKIENDVQSKNNTTESEDKNSSVESSTDADPA